MTKSIRAFTYGLCLLAAIALVPVTSGAQERTGNQSITGTVVTIGGVRPGQSWPFTLYVERYTTASEVAQLQAALESKGQQGLLDALEKTDVGRLSVNGRAGVPVNAIIPSPTETGTKLTILYERTVGFSELRYGARSENYRVGYMEMFLDRTGKGQGMAIPAARVSVQDNGTWEVENFGIYPARLVNLRTHTS
jgi:hypothetical protein